MLRNHHPHARELWQQGLLAAELGALGPDVKFVEAKFPVVQRSASG